MLFRYLESVLSIDLSSPIELKRFSVAYDLSICHHGRLNSFNLVGHTIDLLN